VPAKRAKEVGRLHVFHAGNSLFTAGDFRLMAAIAPAPPMSQMRVGLAWGHVEIRHRLSGIGAMNRQSAKDSTMPEVTIVYWRDSPAQVIVGKGRTGAKVKLTERFEQAIDRCAMKIGAKDADAYLAEWRKAEPFAVEGDQTEIAAAEAAKIETTYDTERLKALIAADGWAKA
jgi:hypothetical protein